MVSLDTRTQYQISLMKKFLCMPLCLLLYKVQNQRDFIATLIMKKDFDTFSFRGASQRKRDSVDRDQLFQQPHLVPKPKNWKQMTYRFEQKIPNNANKSLIFESHFVNQKINRIQQELTENIRRRIDLQKKLYQQRRDAKQIQNQKFFKENYVKSDIEGTQAFVNVQKRSQAVSNMLERTKKSSKQQTYLDYVEKQGQTKIIKTLKKQSKIKAYLAADPIRIQKLLRIATFPQIPKCNLQKLQNQCEQLMINSQHSDIIYIMMVVSFHLQKYHNVRKYFRQIQMYKVFQIKAYWVACQTQYELENYELCLKLSDKCMKQISDVHLPRFVFLQARSYDKIGNHINSIVCYNQLIKMKPDIAQLYLERGVIYDKIGYPMEARQDYIQFSAREPLARQILKQKIMTEKDQIKRKQIIKAMAKIS